MKKALFLISTFLFISGFAIAQETGRNFNAGLSIGGGGVHYILMPSVDLSWKNTMFRVSPFLPVFIVRLVFEGPLVHEQEIYE